MTGPRPKVLIVGMDGATWDVILPMVERGELPNFARVMREGAWGGLESTYRNNSMSAWMALLTGQNPGRFGLYGFEQCQTGSYDSRIVNSRGKLGATLLRRLGDAGLRVAAVNVPPIYPPEAVNGIVVTGILTPDREAGYTYPPELRGELEAVCPEYLIEPAVFCPGHEASYLDQVEQSTRSTLAAWRHFWPREHWDYFIAVFVAPDRVQHFLWHYTDPTHPRYLPGAGARYGAAIGQTYHRMDEVLGEIVAGIDSDTTLIIASDHGFGPCRRAFNLSEWLMQEGFLALGSRAPLPVYFDFIDHLLDAEIETPIVDYAAAKETVFSIGRNWRRVLFEHPPCVLRWRLTLPKEATFRAAMAVDPRTWVSDRGAGAQFAVRVDGETLFHQALDPKNKLIERRWHDCDVDLARFGGRRVTIELVTDYDASAAGTFAWAGWANPCIVSRDPAVEAERVIREEEWIDWSRTTAYAYDDMSIRLNVRGREAEGVVQPGAAYEMLRDELAARLLAIKNPETGDRLLARVRRREDVCWGDFAGDEADLILEFADQSWTVGVPANSGEWTVSDGEGAALWGPTGSDYPSGNHRPNGIIVAYGRGIRPGARLDRASILDVAPTVLRVLGYSVPEDLDGRPLTEALDIGAPDTPLAEVDVVGIGGTVAVYSEDDERRVRQRLAALGYVEE